MWTSIRRFWVLAATLSRQDRSFLESEQDVPMPSTYLPKPARRRATGVLLLVLAALALRTAATYARWGQLRRDPDAYRLIAENVALRGVFSRAPQNEPPTPTAFRPPIYPLMLALISPTSPASPLRVAVFHVLLGMLTVLVTWAVARRWGLGRWSYLAAVLVACDPILLNQSSQVMTETLATLIAVVCLWTLTRWNPVMSWRNAIINGSLLGLAVLCRPTFLIWAAFVGLYLFWQSRSRVAFFRASALMMGVVMVLAPWAIRNQAVLGRPVFATTHGGYTLLLGNNRFFYAHLRSQPWGTIWDARQLQRWLASQHLDHRAANTAERLPELDRDRCLYAIALETIREQPRMFLYASLIRFGRLWSPLPHALEQNESAGRRLMRWGIAGWYVVVLGAAGVSLIRRRWSWRAPPWVWGICLVLAFTAVHTIYWSNLRMRAPLMPVVCILAVGLLCRSPAGSPSSTDISGVPNGSDGG